MVLRIYPFVISKYVQRLLYIHTGFDDRSLIWVVNGEVMDLFFIKLKNYQP